MSKTAALDNLTSRLLQASQSRFVCTRCGASRPIIRDTQIRLASPDWPVCCGRKMGIRFEASENAQA
jgi:hypothetical protein